MTLIERFLTGEYQVTRTARGTYIGGFYHPGPKQIFKIRASLQPLNPRELKMVEEGYRFKQLWKLFSDHRLIAMDTHSEATSDRVLINGDSYRVISVVPWQNVDLPYFRSIVMREPENP